MLLQPECYLTQIFVELKCMFMHYKHKESIFYSSKYKNCDKNAKKSSKQTFPDIPVLNPCSHSKLNCFFLLSSISLSLSLSMHKLYQKSCEERVSWFFYQERRCTITI